MTTPLQLIMATLDEFNIDDFIDENFNGIAAHKIISTLEWHNFKIVPLERARDVVSESGR